LCGKPGEDGNLSTNSFYRKDNDAKCSGSARGNEEQLLVVMEETEDQPQKTWEKQRMPPVLK
jgi:hypothetical protein